MRALSLQETITVSAAGAMTFDSAIQESIMDAAKAGILIEQAFKQGLDSYFSEPKQIEQAKKFLTILAFVGSMGRKIYKNPELLDGFTFG